MEFRAHTKLLSATALYLLAIAQITTSTSGTITGSLSTCPARSINYITQSLPQQCFTTSWNGNPSMQTTAINTTSPETDAPTSIRGTSVLTSDSSDSSATSTTSVDSNDEILTRSNNNRKEVETSTTSPPLKEAEPTEDSRQENEIESALDNTNFLSFEEWKHQNLAKAGQSADNMGPRQGGNGPEHRRRPGNINNALESLGEDTEIEIDFSGFVSPGVMSQALPSQSPWPVSASIAEEEIVKQTSDNLSNSHKRSKDAGKTCKERSNYASFDCAATILKANPECKSATSVLVESKDSYMLNVCSANNKFLIVELCDDILIDTIVLANFEYFSSMFRSFRVSVSDRYPVKMDKWKELGTFEARNSREIQAFLVENPLIWARYLRIELLSHYGAEYYCPVSLLRVHGTTMMEEFNHEVKGLRTEDDIEDEVEEIKDEATIHQRSIDTADAKISKIENISEQPPKSAPSNLILTKAAVEAHVDSPQTAVTQASHGEPTQVTESTTPYESSIGKALEDILFGKRDGAGQSSPTHQSIEASSTVQASPKVVRNSEELAKSIEKLHLRNENGTPSQETKQLNGGSPSDSPDPKSNMSSLSYPSLDQNRTSLSANTSSSIPTHSATSSASISSIVPPTDTIIRSAEVEATSSEAASVNLSSKANSTSAAMSSPTERSSSHSPSFASPASSSSATTSVATTTTKISSSSVQPPAANPSTQESFFKSVHKRLQQLETNSTLSLQYIEEQSRILRDAFSKVEKRQLSKTSSFLEMLNTTVMTELRDFRTQYDQIWQSTVLELSSQREQSAHEVSALSARMSFLADEIIFQKRIAMIQFILILLCLGLVLFPRPRSVSTHLEFPPLVQNAITRSSANLARYTNIETPSVSPSPSRPSSSRVPSKFNPFHRRAHRREPSDVSDVNGGIQSPNTAYAPPSPESQVSREDREMSSNGPSGDDADNLGF